MRLRPRVDILKGTAAAAAAARRLRLTELLLSHLEIGRVALEHLLELLIKPINETVVCEVGMAHEFLARAAVVRVVPQAILHQLQLVVGKCRELGLQRLRLLHLIGDLDADEERVGAEDFEQLRRKLAEAAHDVEELHTRET